MKRAEGAQLWVADRLGTFDHGVGYAQGVERVQQLVRLRGGQGRDALRHADEFHTTDFAGDEYIFPVLGEPSGEGS